MTLPGKFEVTDTGSASYTIPISLVPGTAGLEPKLSLQYDSRSGNGLLGVGWSLAGLPAITRCGRTIAQDGAVGGVSYDADDRFCLDGQRLIAITGGTYGADQTEYRTERESFSKVISYGTVSGGSGPSYFKVWTKAGLVMEFGHTDDSKIEAQGKSSVRVWALNKTSDTKGNYFTVSYSEDSTNGEYRPLRINYNGAEGTATNNSVRFVYETRPDIVPMYQAGSLIKTTQRMKKVQAFHGEDLTHDYALSYEAGIATQRSRVGRIEKCTLSQECLTTSFVWSGNGAPEFGATTVQAPTPSFEGFFTDVYATTLPIDADGNGKVDLVQVGNSTNIAQTLSFVGTNFITAYKQPLNTAGFARHSWGALQVGDIDGDGLSDAVQISNDTNTGQSLLSNGNGSYRVVYTHPLNTPGFARQSWGGPVMGDVDGDGRADIIQISNDTNSGQVLLSNGDGSFRVAYSHPLNAPGFSRQTWGGIFAADVNGDGLTDIVQISRDTNTGQSLLSNGDGSYRLAYTHPLNTPGFARLSWGAVFMADVNGDGLADVIQIGHDANVAQVLLSKGDGSFEVVFEQPLNAPPFGRLSWGKIFITDVNGDGKADVVQISNSSAEARINLSNGDGTFRTLNITVLQPTSSGGYNVLDVDGDARPEFLQINTASGGYSATLYSLSSERMLPDQIIKIVGNSGAVTEVLMVSLSAATAGYAKDTGLSACAYPCVDVQGALYVVSEVKSSNGIDAMPYRSTYRYAGAKADQHGRGFLGFRQMTVRDEQTGVEQVTTYRQVHPDTKQTEHAFVGLVASREKRLGAQLLNRSTNTYSSTNLGGTRRYPFLTQSLEESWELTGAALPAVTTAYEYDDFGNARQVSISTGDGHSKTTVNTYDNTATGGAWLLGRLRRSEVTSTTPSQ